MVDTRLFNIQFRHGGAVIKGGQKGLEGETLEGGNRRTFRGGNQSVLRGRSMDLSLSHVSGPLVRATQVLNPQIHRTAQGGIQRHFRGGNQSVLRGRSMDLSQSHKSGPLVRATRVLNTQIHRTANGGIGGRLQRGIQSHGRAGQVVGNSPGDRASPGSELLNRLKGQVGAKGPVGGRKLVNGLS